MRAYKFRSAAQIEFALDILINNRLRCSDWRTLNDPMEGMYVYAYAPGGERRAERIADAIGSAKSQYKVCSLSRTFQPHLLWSHYAGGFSGLAIEVELPPAPNIQRVRYRGVFEFLDMDAVRDQDEAARRILFSKYKEWRYEEEVRILSPGEWYHLDRKPLRVIVGHRMNLALQSTLALVCERMGIDFRRVGIGDEGLDADSVGDLLDVFDGDTGPRPGRGFGRHGT
jgi:hypothetical protein